MEKKSVKIPESLGTSLAENEAVIKRIMESCHDFIFRRITIPSIGRDAAVMYIDGLVKQDMIYDSALMPLVVLIKDVDADITLEDISTQLVASSEASVTSDFRSALDRMMHGDALILVDGLAGQLVMNARGWEKRSITEPQTETVVRGPREGFTETLRTNTALLRRRIASPDLKIEMTQVGERSRTNIAIAYMGELVRPGLVEEIKSRLANIHIDLTNGSGTLDDFIKDSPYSAFETVYYSEKPDVIAGHIMEGRAAIIADGTPFVLTAPMLFIENFQSAEDYLIGSAYGTFLRVIRIISFIISFLTPALYVALTTYHQALIPAPLLFTMAAAAEGLPFPALTETMVMLLIFEILKEAGIRLPKPVGQAVSIVGALVMGQAAIQAGIVGAPVVIVVALTGVANFGVPTLANSVSLIRWIFLLLAGFLGGFGVTLGVLALLVHLTSLRSFGVPHMAPFAPLIGSDLVDSVFRAPAWKLTYRPISIGSPNKRRAWFKRPDFREDNLK